MTAWGRYVHAEEVWGTVVTMDLRGPDLDDARAAAACAEAALELHRIDVWLSPFRPDSEVSLIRAGVLRPEEASEPVRAVVAGCAAATAMTGGAFDPWQVPGGFDPCGYVKGWGADRAAEILVAHGFANVSVNAAGDVTCRGQSNPDLDGWRIGVADPRDRRQVITSVVVRDAHLATSGRYEQGDHIVDPGTGDRAVAVCSATVLAADGGLADALATALVVRGAAGLPAVAERQLSAYLVTGGHVWTSGEAFRTTVSAAR